MCAELTAVLVSLGPLKIGALLEGNQAWNYDSQGGTYALLKNKIKIL